MQVVSVVSTHSRAEAAAWRREVRKPCKKVSTHSRAEAAANCLAVKRNSLLFQHTAARRRLLIASLIGTEALCFNTQPRGGGCIELERMELEERVSTHSRAEAAALHCSNVLLSTLVSTHSRAEAAA